MAWGLATVDVVLKKVNLRENERKIELVVIAYLQSYLDCYTGGIGKLQSILPPSETVKSE